MPRTHTDIADVVLARFGRTYAADAEIPLKDTPSPLYRLLVLATLLSARISADVGVSAARELSSAGLRTPEKMLHAPWQQRVDALGRGHYRRYDESTARLLGDAAQLLLDDYRGDLRRLRDQTESTADVLRQLQRFPGIGPTGAAIFTREVQGVWPQVAPFFDDRALAGARRVGLPDSPRGLAALVGPADLPRLAAGLVRIALDRSSGTPLSEG